MFKYFRSEEIIMPAEQTGLVRENYLWKVLLRRGEGKDGEFSHVLDPIYDKQLFQLTWGSTVRSTMFKKIKLIYFQSYSLQHLDRCLTKSQKFPLSRKLWKALFKLQQSLHTSIFMKSSMRSS